MFVLHLLFFLCAIHYCQAGCQFIFAIPELKGYNTNQKEAEIRLFNSGTDIAQVKISMPKMSSFTAVTIAIDANNLQTKNIQSSYMLVGSNLEDKGILVEILSGIVSVEYIIYSKYSSGSVSLFPLADLNIEYVAVSYRYDASNMDDAFLAIVATADATTVTISVKGYLTWQTTGYADGAIITINLNAFQTAQLLTRRSQGKNTGSQITSTHPIAVICGVKWTPVENGYYEDHIVEMLPPLNLLGNKYVVSSFEGRTSGDLVEIVATHGPVDVTATTNTGSILVTQSIQHLDSYSFDLTSGSSIYVHGTVAFLLVQYMKSGVVDGTQTDGIMIFHRSISQWSSKYIFNPSLNLISNNGYNNKMSLCAKIVDTGKILENGNQVSGWNDIGSTGFSCTSIKPISSLLLITSTSPYAAYVYAGAQYEGYGSWASSPCINIDETTTYKTTSKEEIRTTVGETTIIDSAGKETTVKGTTQVILTSTDDTETTKLDSTVVETTIEPTASVGIAAGDTTVEETTATAKQITVKTSKQTTVERLIPLQLTTKSTTRKPTDSLSQLQTSTNAPDGTTSKMHLSTEKVTPEIQIGFGWHVWTPWTKCSLTCGMGTQYRLRLCSSISTCNKKVISPPGKPDVYYTINYEVCNAGPCYGEWTHWSLWSECPSTCNITTTKRVRKCSKDVCKGKSVQSMMCPKCSSVADGKQPAEESSWTESDSRPSAIAVSSSCFVLILLEAVALILCDLLSLYIHFEKRQRRRQNNHYHQN